MAKIKSIKKINNIYALSNGGKKNRTDRVYDIEVKDNHNYIANDLLVSNSSSKSYVDLNKKYWNHIYNRCFLSATPFRNDNSDLELKGMIGENIYEYPAIKAIKDGYLIPPTFFIYNVKQSIPYHLINKYDSYPNIYNDYVVNNKNRNDLIANITNELAQEKTSKILIVVERIEHGEILNKIIPNSTFIHGELKDNKKTIENFNLDGNKILISTSGIISEGIDIPCLNVLINAGAGKSKIQMIQRVGRVLRLHKNKKNAIIIDFNDICVPFLEKQSKKRIEYYKEFDTKINMI